MQSFTIRLDTQLSGKGTLGKFRIWHGEKVVDHAETAEQAAGKVAIMLRLGMVNVTVTH